MSKSFRYSENPKNPSPSRKFSAPKPLKPSQKSKSSLSKPPLTSNTPNFGRPPNIPNVQDSKLEESLDISEISKPQKKSFENFSKPQPSSSTSNFHSSIQSHLNKYDQAFALLTTNFQKYQSDTENHFQSLHENLASIKNSTKFQSNFKENLEKFVKKQTKQAGSLLFQEFSNICKEITNSDKFSKNNIEKLHQMQEDYDQKLQENEEYLQSFDNYKSSNATRSKSSINHYFSSLAEENKRLRADLSKLWNRS